MDKEDIIEALKILQKSGDTEIAHGEADDLLTDFLCHLGYEDIVSEYNKIEKWYA